MAACGHAEADLRLRRDGTRFCATCRRLRNQRRRERRRDEHPRAPLVLAATRTAAAQARHLGVHGLESAVGVALVAGQVASAPHAMRARLGDGGRLRAVTLAGGLRVLIRADRSPLSGRRAWRPVRVERLAEAT